MVALMYRWRRPREFRVSLDGQRYRFRAVILSYDGISALSEPFASSTTYAALEAFVSLAANQFRTRIIDRDRRA